MLLGFILRRMWRERRRIGVLLLALCLVTTFMALGPLLVRAVAGAEFQLRLDALTTRQNRIDLVGALPFPHDATQAVITDTLGDYLQTVTRYQSSAGTVCGFLYDPEGTDLRSAQSSDSQHCYQVFAYHEYDDLFTLAEGHAPEARADGIVETVITRSALDLLKSFFPGSSFGIGSRFIVGEDPFTAVTVEVVGIVEPVQSADAPFWDGQGWLFGQIIPISIDFQRVEFGFIVSEDDFAAQIVPAIQEQQAVWRLGMDYSGLRVADLLMFKERLAEFETRIHSANPSAAVRAGIADVLDAFEVTIAATEAPIILLAGLVLVLMFYNLVTTTTLILEEQRGEWAILSSRGGSSTQLIYIQFVTALVLGGLALLAGPFGAGVIVRLLARIGPQAGLLVVPEWSQIPANTWWLSLAAAAAAVIILTLPALALGRSSLLQLRQSASRPPVNPGWARYYLDIMLLAVGLGFTARLYFFLSGELSLEPLLQNPVALIHMITENGAAGLSDPFNLLGPVLVLTGFALLCLRLFPALMRLLSFLFQPFNNLLLQLSLWNVERDPNHYAQLVLLIMGTLALGTASLALAYTRDAGAWQVAQAETGADVLVEFRPGAFSAAAAVGLPGVTQAVPVMAVNWAENIDGAPPVMLYGVDLADPSFYGDALLPLQNTAAPPLPGEPLPESVARIQLDVYAVPDEDTVGPVETQLLLVLYDADFLPVALPMTTPDPTLSRQFMTYTADLSGLSPGEWRLVGIRLASRLEDDTPRFWHEVYLDNLVAVSADGRETVLNSFDEASRDQWRWGADSRQIGEVLSLATEDTIVSEGGSSMRVVYESLPFSPQLPMLNWRPQAGAMPALVSPGFVRRFNLGGADVVGETFTTRLDWTIGREAINQTVFTYQVAGLITDFPGTNPDETFLVTDRAWLQLQANARLRNQAAYAFNRLWLMLENSQPTDSLAAALDALPGVTGVHYAWERYQVVQRDPLANGVSGILFAGFCLALALILLDFAFYLGVSLRRRAVSFAVLRVMGWRRNHLLGLMLVEQAAFITPALLVGVLLGVLMAYVILPFLALIGGTTLQLPVGAVALLLGTLVGSFSVLLLALGFAYQRGGLADTMRMGD
ncbi:MAG: hypothetical protein H6672_08090 [Anaerolineaceae bacterium]|nr:hypothetical protein [Anaerolineaceae bacterium]